jgi:hypothetical protein
MLVIQPSVAQLSVPSSILRSNYKAEDSEDPSLVGSIGFIVSEHTPCRTGFSG